LPERLYAQLIGVFRYTDRESTGRLVFLAVSEQWPPISFTDTLLQSHFLRLEPWGQYAFFRSFVTVPFMAQDPKAIDVVQFILEQCLLRREKNMKDKDGKPIVDLPLKTVSEMMLWYLLYGAQV
jgi:hypothetical protein